MRFPSRAVLGFLLGIGAAAQAPSRPKISDAVAWAPQGWLLLPFQPGVRPVLEDASHARRSLAPPPGQVESNQWTVRNGALYQVGVSATEDRVDLFRLDLGAKPGAWERLGRFDTLDHGLPPVQAYPLDESNRYLGLSWMGGFTDGRKASFAAIFRDSGGRMVFDGLVDMPFGERGSMGTFVPDGADPSKGGSCAASHPALEPTLAAPVATDRYAFLAATRAGVLWAFDLRNGHCAKTVNLGGLDEKSLPSALLVDHFILAAEPDRNGDLIVATRDPEAMAVAEVFQPNPALGKEAVAKSMSDFAEAAKSFAGIRWWVVDGKTLEARLAAGDRFPQIKGLDYRHISRFKFLIDADGQIRTSLDGHWNEFMQRMASPPPRESKGAKAPKAGAPDPK